MPNDNRILKKLLDRLFGALVNGPSLNCRPHSSRQRFDLVQLGKFRDQTPEAVLRSLLGPDRVAKVSARVPVPRGRAAEVVGADEADDELSPEERAARQAYREQQSVLAKLRGIAEDARTYENDTGVHVLQIGFPLLSLPPGSAGGFGLTRRILAPLAFVSLSMKVKAGPTPSVALECRNEGIDLVVPNVALLAWLEGQTGQPIGDLERDERGERPWAEICSIARRICELVQIALPPLFAAAAGDELPEDFKLVASPRADDDAEPKPSIVPAAVVGLYPMANQGLLRDMQALVAGEPTGGGPIESFLRVGVSLDAPAPSQPGDGEEAPIVERRLRAFADERLVTVADPCQARAVRLARTSRGLVVHGPPGTGKSQTIANVVGDHLARGERVLFVCDKRTALDVVINRLEGMGLGSLCAVVHDPQRDQRELYKGIREQLDALPDARTEAAADARLAAVDAELQAIHDELTAYHASLMTRPEPGGDSFHELMGEWLALPPSSVAFEADLVERAPRALIEANARELGDLFDRAARVGFTSNPWDAAAGMALDAYLLAPMAGLRAQLASLESAAKALGTPPDDRVGALPATGELGTTASRWNDLAGRVEHLAATTPAETRARLVAALSGAEIDALREQLEAARDDVGALPSEADWASIGAIAPEYAPSAAAVDAQLDWVDRYAQAASTFASAARAGGSEAELDAALQGVVRCVREAADRGFTRGPKFEASALPLDRVIVELNADGTADTADLLRAARDLDRATGRGVLPFPPEPSPSEVGRARAAIADELARARDRVPPEPRSRWAAIEPAKLGGMLTRLRAAEPIADAIEREPLDASILLLVQERMPGPAEIESDRRALDALVAAPTGFLGIFVGRAARSAGAAVLQRYGLGPSDVERCRRFLDGVKQRLALRLTLAEAGVPATGPIPADAELVDSCRSLRALAELLQRLHAEPALRDAAAAACAWLKGDASAGDAPDALRASAARGEAIAAFARAVESESVPKPTADWLVGRGRAGRSCLLPSRLLASASDRGAAGEREAGASRVRALLRGVRASLRVDAAVRALAPDGSIDLRAPAALAAAWRDRRAVAEVMHSVRSEPSLAPLSPAVSAALADDAQAGRLVAGLRASAAWAERVAALESAIDVGLLSAAARDRLSQSARSGADVAASIAALANRFDSLEDVLRVRDTLGRLPEPLVDAAARLVAQNVAGDVALGALRKAAVTAEITRRLRTDRRLTATDARQLQSSFQRYAELESAKKSLVRQSVLHRWTSRQRERLLASTGTRLNSLGADLRRRLTTRGERAMRLRQVVAVGAKIEGGDPLFDLRPVWMASPETVAQIFPRERLFDVVIFDEASQCRLEEALPVLLRAARVVIAGDPKQLPPTRFFESAVAASDEEEAETEQELFESQQGEIEDLLGAALNIEIEECYLDVHYRSRNSALIEFSNDNFYNRRLQAVPGHPKNRVRYAPLTLYKTNGTYEKRTNLAEADRVVQIVHDLLKRAEPPTIGIACFNIAQRDLIVERLEARAAEDAAFGKALASARERRSASSFEGLFVKNLENVQGDERDHMIISTTYGPDAKGRFYRRFGPVGGAGGARRLNVLVTRARDEIHLVTSIPEGVYRNLPPVPPGGSPSGAWLLFAYLLYAEQLADYFERHRQREPDEAAPPAADVTVRDTRFPSKFATGLAAALRARPGIGSDVHWGNDGFCVDLGLRHPRRPGDVTIGVLCDMNRFGQAADPVEWEVFRTSMLATQGWSFHRVWTPHFFRDAEASIAGIARDAEQALADESDPDALAVDPT